MSVSGKKTTHRLVKADGKVLCDLSDEEVTYLRSLGVRFEGEPIDPDTDLDAAFADLMKEDVGER